MLIHLHKQATTTPKVRAASRSDEANTRAGGKMLDQGDDSADLALDRQAAWGMSAMGRAIA